jgi:hypothetical protein
VLFLGEKVVVKEPANLNAAGGILCFFLFMSTLIIITVVGSLGYKVVPKMPIPFFSAIKAISVMEALIRIESILLSVWVVSDFGVITVLR